MSAFSLVLLTSSIFVEHARAGGDDQWLSPVYTNFFQYPLPFPPDKAIK